MSYPIKSVDPPGPSVLRLHTTPGGRSKSLPRAYLTLLQDSVFITRFLDRICLSGRNLSTHRDPNRGLETWSGSDTEGRVPVDESDAFLET